MASLLDLLGQTWPARLAQSAWGAAKLPGDVYAGRVDPLSDEGIGRAADLAGMTMGGTFATAPRGALGTGPGIRAYHGSPHDFDRFDMSKIGTGEGAQSYGHGLYFAENEGVAGSYKSNLSQAPRVHGQPVGEHSGAAEAFLYRANGDVNKAITDAQAMLSGLEQSTKKADQFRADGAKKAIEKLNQWKSDNAVQPPGGRMYEVNIKAKPEEFLDWDKKISEQSPQVQAAVKQIWEDAANARLAPLYGEPSKYTGEGLHGSLQSYYMGYGMPRSAGKDAVAKDLKSAGIPGIKYLDQGSRAGGEGTSNYVLFRDDIIEIVKKYGWAGLAAFGISEDQAKAAGIEKPKATKIGRQKYEM